MRRLLIVGALASAALLAQDKTDPWRPSEDTDKKAFDNATRGWDMPTAARGFGRGAAPAQLPGGATCLAPMPVARPGDADIKMVVPPQRSSFGMPTVAPPPTCSKKPGS